MANYLRVLLFHLTSLGTGGAETGMIIHVGKGIGYGCRNYQLMFPRPPCRSIIKIEEERELIMTLKDD